MALKGKYNRNPEKANILLAPTKNVDLKPFPRIGSARSGTKRWEMLNIIIIMLIIIIGSKIKLALEIAFNPILLDKIQGRRKKSIIKSIGVDGKYITLRASEKYFKTIAREIEKEIINANPINTFNILPPKNSAISIISLPGKGLNKFTISKHKITAKILT